MKKSTDFDPTLHDGQPRRGIVKPAGRDDSEEEIVKPAGRDDSDAETGREESSGRAAEKE